MIRRRSAASAAALAAALLLTAACNAAVGDASGSRATAEPLSAPSSAPASERSMREIIAAQATRPPVPPEDQPLAPGSTEPVMHDSARVEDVEVVDKPVPTRVRIPALGVDATVVALGVAPNGEMDVPGNAGTVAWYEYGPSPGQDGSAVLAAHVDYNGARGVFFDLARLDRGAEVMVEFAGGRTRSFVVDQRASVAKDALQIDELFRREGAAVLTLITCGGEFDAAARSYRSNVVVRAKPGRR